MFNRRFMKFFMLILGSFVLFFSVLGVGHAELVLQGKLQKKLRQAAVNEKIKVSLRIYDDEFSGKLIFEEAQEFPAKTEVLAFRLGQGTIKTSRSGTGKTLG